MWGVPLRNFYFFYIFHLLLFLLFFFFLRGGLGQRWKIPDLSPKKIYSKLALQKEILKKDNLCSRPLGPRQKVLEADRKEFSDIVDVLTENIIDDLLSSLKPIQWRDFIVRMTNLFCHFYHKKCT